MSLRVICFIFIAMFVGACQANPIFFTKANKLVYFPECTDPTGLKVQWIGVPVEVLIKYNARAAIGVRSKTPAFGEYAKVLYNKDSLPHAQDEWIRFILYHECAHHTLGHLLPDYPPPSIPDEWIADCVAVRKLKAEKVPFARINILSRIYLKSKSDTHGDIESRINNMRQCYDSL